MHLMDVFQMVWEAHACPLMNDEALGCWSLYMSSYVDVAHVGDCLFDNDHNVLAMAENALGEIAWNSCRYALDGGLHEVEELGQDVDAHGAPEMVLMCTLMGSHIWRSPLLL